MKTIQDNNIAGIAPLLIFFLIIAIAGLLVGIFDAIMAPVMNQNNTMNLLMSRAWWFLIVIIFIVVVSWLLHKAQKSQFPGGGGL
jgi:high-affinity Fe2+/Pb2+ permease